MKIRYALAMAFALLLCSCSANNIRRTAYVSIDMEPTIKKGESLSYDTNASGLSSICRFDVVAYYNSKIGKLACHRVVGLPNETVFLQGRMVYVDDKALLIPQELSFVNYIVTDDCVRFPYVVPKDSFFLVADRPMTVAKDSRIIGAVNIKDIKGKVISLKPLIFSPSTGVKDQRKPGEITEDEKKLLNELEENEKRQK